MRHLIAAVVLLLGAGTGHAADLPPELVLFRSIYKELVEINTTDSVGDSIKAAEAMAARLRAGGLPDADIQVLSSGPRKGNLVARLRGTGARRPILLIAHLDVVEAKREDWAFDPFVLQEVDGYFRGRGTLDDKAMAASFVANLILYAKEGFKPDRDIILALTADEELSDSPHDGAKWLLQNHRALIDAELAINEGGGGALRDGKPARQSVQLAEKIYQTYRLEVKDPGGHSAVPRPENAIYRLADALRRLAAFQFPIRLNPVTQGYFERVGPTEAPEVARAIAALLSGRSDGAALAPLTLWPGFNLPQTARATVNCRILPDEAVADVERALVAAIDDPKVAVMPVGTAVASPPSSLSPEVMGAVERLTAQMWPGVPVIPTMSGGYTDSRWLRSVGIPAYGVSGLFSDLGNNGVHGLNEQVGVQQLYDSRLFLYRLVKLLAKKDAVLD